MLLENKNKKDLGINVGVCVCARVCMCVRVCVCVRCVLSSVRVQLFATPWSIACQAPLSMGFSRQEYWSGLPFPTPDDLLEPGMETASLTSPPLASRLFTTGTTWEAIHYNNPR